MLKKINLPLLLISILLVVILTYKLPYWYMHPLSVSPDQSVYLEMAQLILQGKTPYLDFFDFNPPLIMYLSTIPVMLSKVLSLPVAFGFNCFILALHIVLTVLCGALIYIHRAVYKPILFVPVLIVFALFTPGLVSDLGQREHIFTLLFVPFLILRGLTHARVESNKLLALTIGLLAGLGLCLKPQFVIIWLASELGFLLNQWRQPELINPFKSAILKRSPELLACALVPIAYGIGFMLLPESARQLYAQDAVPVYMYGASWNSRCLMHMLCGFSYFAEPLTQILLALFLLPLVRRAYFAAPLALLILGSLVSYVSGAQAWTYRLLPAALFAQMLLAYQFGHFLQFVQTRVRRLGLSPYLFNCAIDGLALAIACGVSVFYLSQFYGQWQGEPRFDLASRGFAGEEPRSDFDSMFFAIAANSRPGEPVVHIGSGIRPGYPSQLQSLNPPGSRYLYSYLVMFATAMSNKPEFMDRFREQERRMVGELGTDILKNHPRLVFVQQFPIEDILQKYDFKRKYLANYRDAGFVEGCRIYKLETAATK